MFGLIVISLFGCLALFYNKLSDEQTSDQLPARVSKKLDQLWLIAVDSIKNKKYYRAEKALLTILKIDMKNPTAYNRLGILYAMQRDYKDAIECFEIAQSLEPSASSLHNVGLIYFETGDLERAAIAFEQAIALEEDIPSRHIAYAKVQEKMGNKGKRVSALERALELDQNPQILTLLAQAYEETGQADLAEELNRKAAGMIAPQATTTARPTVGHKRPAPARNSGRKKIIM